MRVKQHIYKFYANCDDFYSSLVDFVSVRLLALVCCLMDRRDYRCTSLAVSGNLVGAGIMQILPSAAHTPAGRITEDPRVQ